MNNFTAHIFIDADPAWPFAASAHLVELSFLTHQLAMLQEIAATMTNPPLCPQCQARLQLKQPDRFTCDDHQVVWFYALDKWLIDGTEYSDEECQKYQKLKAFI